MNDKQLHIIQMYDFSRLHTQWHNWRGEEVRITPPGKCSSHGSATATCEQSRPKQDGKDQANETYKW